MQVVHRVAELRAALADQPGAAFVPTMGNLHAGDVSLVELARQHGNPVVASIFVNPLQFGAGEDYERYPRTLAADCAQLEEAGCNLVFAPTFPSSIRSRRPSPCSRRRRSPATCAVPSVPVISAEWRRWC